MRVISRRTSNLMLIIDVSLVMMGVGLLLLCVGASVGMDNYGALSPELANERRQALTGVLIGLVLMVVGGMLFTFFI
jgi:Sec-independent protein secretion pathway component TatC